PSHTRSTLFPYTTLFRSRRLTEGIYSLRYPNAFYSQLLGAGTVEFANQLGVPLSTTETVSSGIIGSGLASKMRVMNSRNVFLIRSEEHTSELQSRSDIVC